jgi:hypothetical protein
MRKHLFTVTAALALAAAACGKTRIYPVSGKVTYRGEPAAGAAVFFHARGKEPIEQHTVMGIVGEDGTFELVCDALGKGAPPGEYDVVIQWTFQPALRTLEGAQHKPASRQGKGLGGHMPDRLRGRYADPKRPLLHATVQAGKNNLPPFELTDE